MRVAVALSLFQDCRPDARWGANGSGTERLDRTVVRRRGGARTAVPSSGWTERRSDAREGANGSAIERLEAGWLGDTCVAGPASAFSEAAGVVEARLFGTAEQVTLPMDLPSRLPLA